jgi:type IV pilus biogenesis protein PilP
MQNNSTRLLLLPLAALLSGPALADTTAEALTKIEAETLVLKAQERQLTVKAQILQLQAEITAREASADQNARPGAPGDPTVQSIEGIGNILHATLLFENGSTIDVKGGDMLPNGMRVVSIQNNEVMVANDRKRRIRLAQTSASTVSAASGAVQTTVALPMMSGSNYAPVPKLPMKGSSR